MPSHPGLQTCCAVGCTKPASRLVGLLNYARGNQYVLDKIHSALDHPPSKVGP